MARFTDRQLEDAKRTDLAAFLRSKGERLIKSGSEYRWVYRDGAGEHDSVTIRGSEWFDHKRQLGGDAIGFVQEFYNMSFREAVEALIRQEPGRNLRPAERPAPDKVGCRTNSFVLQPKAANMHRLYAYLCKTRNIAPEVVSHFVHAGTLYEDSEYHNAVFIATDEHGNTCGGMKKGTLSGSSFRQTIAGSDTQFAFHHKGSSERVYVFEAAVDMLSFISLHPDNWQRHSYLALDGLSPKALFRFLDTHKDVQKICLCLDNDAAGIGATKQISNQLLEKGYSEISMLLPTEKDWSDELKATIEQIPEVEITLCQDLN